MIDPTGRLDGVMEILRRRIAESANRLDVRGKPTAGTGSTPPPGKPSLQDVKRRIKERLAGISKDDPDRPKKARRVFVESILTWEFGDALLLDKRFEEMLEKVQEALGAAPEVNQQFEKFLNSLERD